MHYPDELWRSLDQYLVSTARAIIAIDGPAGSGKTTLADEVMRYLLGKGLTASTIHMDDLYDGWEQPLSEALTNKLAALIHSHLDESALEVPQYDWDASCFATPLILHPTSALILEGVGAGQREVREYGAFTIWIESEPTIGLSRVLAREPYLSEALMKSWQRQEQDYFTADETEVAANIKHST